ncbi:MAG: ZIP family metal transporter, partial [archaeon]
WIAIAAFVSTLIGGLIAIRLKKALPFFFAFSTGTLIAVAFLDLLPESIELAQGIALDTKYIFLTIVLSFLFYSFLEKYFLAHHHHEDDDHGHILGPIGAGSLVLHSFLDGAAIGAAFQVNPAVGLIVALAVIAHDFTDGINTVTLMLKNKHNSKRAMIFLVMDALAPVLGILLTTLINIDQKILAFILAFFIGEFIYIGAANLLPETHKHKSWFITLFMILGAGLIYLLSNIIA